MSGYITIFGAGRMDENCKEYLDTIEIGRIIARKDYRLINGGYGGIMKASAKGITEEGGTSIGYTCATFKRTVANQYITHPIICNDIFHRLDNLLSRSEIFIVQVGGIGTLSELFLLLDESRKKDNPPKIYLIGDCWQWIFDNPMIQKSCKKLLTVVTDVNQLELLL